MQVSLLEQAKGEEQRATKEGEAMTTAAIYCRVSTENQEAEGTSLDSQLEACLRIAREQCYDVPEEYIIREAWSGLTLERPDLTELRNWVRHNEVDAVIVYSTDRLSRDPVHLLLLVEEFDKKEVKLLFVTEPLDNSMEGQLLTFVRGWASKLEAVKIRERTMRGKRSRALSGKLPSGSHAHLYGYTYLPGKEEGEGIRQVNEDEARWVQEMFRWLVDEQMSTNQIMYRLRSLNAPTPSRKGYWIKRTVGKILRNPAYCGKTYAFTVTYGEPKKRIKPDSKRVKTGIIRKPRNEWVEIPNATPVIISEATFEAAQRQLQKNRETSSRNVNPASRYLLRGHLYCRRCGRTLWAFPGIKTRGRKRYSYPYYICPGNLKQVSPVKCGNSRISASKVEAPVWEQIRAILDEPELVVGEVLRSQKESQDVSQLQRPLERVEAQLANRDKQKTRAWKAFEITGDEETFKANIALLQKEVATLDQERHQLQQRIEANHKFKLDLEDVHRVCELILGNLRDLDFESKRLALDALDVTVWLDDGNLAIEGAIPLSVGQIESPALEWHLPGQHQGN